MDTLQPALVGGECVASDLSLFFSEDHADVLAFLGVALLERIPCSPKRLQYKMLIGRMVNFGHCLEDLRRAFGHDPRTMKQWGAALLSDDPEFIIRAFAGRSQSRKMTPAAARFVKSRYRRLRREGCKRYRKAVGEELTDYFGIEVCSEVLRRLFREADREDDHAATAPSSQEPKNEETSCDPAHTTGKNDVETRNQSPNSAGSFVPPVLADPPARRQAVHHLGTIVFAVLLDVLVLRDKILAQWARQWSGQILQGAVNIEQCREISTSDLGLLVGPVRSDTDTQRRALRDLASLDNVVDVYRAGMAHLTDGPGDNDLFYYDPHAKEYTGMLNTLRGWCGARHGIAKVMYLDAIHTESGRCCFLQHYCAFYDLRERFFMTLALFDRLFPEDRRKARTFALDRGIYGQDALSRFKDSHDYYLTWLKNYAGDAWDENAKTHRFRRYRRRNHAKDLQTYRFACQECRWDKDPSVRLIIVRATNPKGRTIEVAILCSNPDMDLERAVWAMFNRWVQENDFKRLDRHFGLAQLTSYAFSSYEKRADQFEDRAISSPEYRQLRRTCRQSESALTKLLLDEDKTKTKLAESEEALALIMGKLSKLKPTTKAKAEQIDRLKKQRRRYRGNVTRAQKRLAALPDEIAAAREATEKLTMQLTTTLKDASRLELLIKDRMQLLDTCAKSLMDAVRVVCSNMFSALVDHFRPLYNNYRDDHCWLRMLTRASGFVQRRDDVVYVQLWLKGRREPRELAVFRRFLGECSERINAHYAGRALPLRITLCEGPITH